MKPTEIKKLKILIADGNVFFSNTLYSMLEMIGVAKIRTCHTLKDAENILKTSKIDCIFIDFIMENNKGIEFIKKIRTKQIGKNSTEIPIILETGNTDKETIFNARDAGVSEIIGKPFSQDQVLQKLENAINNKREFIDVDEYIGPTRRRHKKNKTAWSGEKDRRSSSHNSNDS